MDFEFSGFRPAGGLEMSLDLISMCTTKDKDLFQRKLVVSK